MMLLPHLLKKSRAAAFSIKNQDKTAPLWVGNQLLLAGLLRDISEQPWHNIVLKGF
jgi:hypothetical protein